MAALLSLTNTQQHITTPRLSNSTLASNHQLTTNSKSYRVSWRQQNGRGMCSQLTCLNFPELLFNTGAYYAKKNHSLFKFWIPNFPSIIAAIQHILQATKTKIPIQWSLRITDTLVHRPLSVIRGVSFIGVFCFSHITFHLNSCLIIILLSTMCFYSHRLTRCTVRFQYLLPTELTSVSVVERSI